MGRGSSGIGAGGGAKSSGGKKAASKIAATLRQAEDRISDDPVESAIAVDENGNVLFEVSDGSKNSVTIGIHERRMAYGKIITHNHPNGYYLSVEDLDTAVSLNLRQIRATTPDGRTFVLERKSDSAQGKALLADYNTQLHGTAQAATNYAYNPSVSWSKNKHLIALYHTKMMNAWLTNVAPRYGYEFREEIRK